MMVKLTARQRSQLPTCYYEGYLEKRSFRDKYVEKVDLRGFVSITDDSSQDRNLDAARLCLQLKDGNIRFTAPNAEARELWKGYIRSVAELSVPASINLLPGQIHMLKETVEKEKTRMLDVAPPALGAAAPDDLHGGRPACFHKVSRLGAELLLEREAERGNLLLRPGSKGDSYAVTTRQDLEGLSKSTGHFTGHFTDLRADLRADACIDFRRQRLPE
ncbi:Signal-transducing adaptor protein 2 [Liparis tanakae]|uniref:Signal-transducing adaptor protein 2 n=1 Tax=Liparis tanakae TaxID=230148 RepID=A0A4Z2HLZ4_9TELE|nr:Signal-transducing adaptor protein 2 [Liparis tanakae]